MKLGKIFICINILVLSLLMLTGCMGIEWNPEIYGGNIFAVPGLFEYNYMVFNRVLS